MQYISFFKSLLLGREKHFIFLVLLSFLVAMFEIATFASIMPFISFVTGNINNEMVSSVLDFIRAISSIDSAIGMIYFMGASIVLIFFIRIIVQVAYTYLCNNFTNSLYSLHLKKLFETYMDIPYRTFIDKNTSDIIKNLHYADKIKAVLGHFLLIMTDIILVFSIYVSMLFIQWKITLLITSIIFVSAIFLGFLTINKNKSLGKSLETMNTSLWRFIQVAVQNFKILKLNEQSKNLENSVNKSVNYMAKIHTIHASINVLPRLIIEAVGVSMMIFIIGYIMFNYSTIEYHLSILTMFLIAFYRLFPAVNRSLINYQSIFLDLRSIELFREETSLDRERVATKSKEIYFNSSIELRNVTFEYLEGHVVIDNVNLSITKGDRVAFIGSSGSGKTTLIDLIIGLYLPLKGQIFIDGKPLDNEYLRSWRHRIGYVPQNIYLFDGSVAQNVAMRSTYDEEFVIKALKKANIYHFFEQKEGILTKVGDAGIALSGGQRQRVAIARALYDDPDVIVLDEATSALDEETEKAVMEELYGITQDKTLIIISHRLSTISKCNKVYSLEKGKVKYICES